MPGRGPETRDGTHRSRSRTGLRIDRCGGGPAGPQYPTGAERAQATYLTDNTESGTTALVDGEMTISLGTWAIGDIDGSDGFDAAAVTIANSGGSGTLYHLHALVDQDDGLCDLGTAFLGTASGSRVSHSATEP